MLPDFPKIKRGLSRALTEYLRELVRQEPLLSQIRRKRYFEGDKTSTKSWEGEIDQSGYKEISGQYSIRREDVITKGPLIYVESMQGIAEEIKKQQAKMVFNKIDEVVRKTGNITDAKGQPFTFDLFIETLEKICIDFDDQGKPHLPTVVVSPDMGAKLKEMLPKWQADPECKRRFDLLLEKKREEWNDRESNRKLVD